MREQEDPEVREESTTSVDPEPPRRPYEPPRITSGKAFERVFGTGGAPIDSFC